MNIINILTILLLGLFPLCFHLIKEEKIYESKEGYIIGCISTLFTMIISCLCLYFGNTSFHIPSIIIGILLNFILAKNLAVQNIEAKKLIKTTGTLILFFCSSLFGYIPITLLGISIDHITPIVNTYITCFSDVCVALILIFMYYDDLKKGFYKAKENFNAFFDFNLKIWIVGFIGMMASNLLINVFAPSAVAGNENAVQGMIDISPFIMLFTAGIIAPIVEELTFRKSLQDIIKNKTVFIIVSGIVFGLLHVVFAYESMIDFLYVIPYSCLGISFAVMVSKTDNICSSIFMHFLHNSGIILLSILTGMIIL